MTKYCKNEEREKELGHENVLFLEKFKNKVK